MKRFKLLVIILLFIVILSGCQNNNVKQNIATNSITPTKTNVLDDNVIENIDLQPEEENEEYTIQNKISKIKLITEYWENTTIDEVESLHMGKFFKKDDRHKEPVDWIVLDRDEEKALLLSKYIINNVSYAKNGIDTTWDMSNLRTWLNDDFYLNAFTDEEKELIIAPIIYHDDNDRWDAPAGTDTIDKMFLLSEEEVKSYFYKENMCDENKLLATYPTTYAKNIDNMGYKLKTADNVDKWFKGYCSYYLRTPGISLKEVSVINQYGYLNTFGAKCQSYNVGVRPAMWVRYQ